MGISLAEPSPPAPDMLDQQIAQGLRRLRQARGWSLDDLSRRSGVSRASLSRLENAEVSATANVLGRLATAFGLTASRLLHQVADDGPPLVRRSEQPVWTDPSSGYIRRSVSPPAHSLVGEVIQGEIPENTRLAYDAPPKPGLEHHLVMLEGSLFLTVAGTRHALQAGDCLRFVLNGPNLFETPAMQGARYLLFMV